MANEVITVRESLTPLKEEYQCKAWQAYLMFDAWLRRQDISPNLVELEGRMDKYLRLLRDLITGL